MNTIQFNEEYIPEGDKDEEDYDEEGVNDLDIKVPTFIKKRFEIDIKQNKNSRNFNRRINKINDIMNHNRIQFNKKQSLIKSQNNDTTEIKC